MDFCNKQNLHQITISCCKYNWQACATMTIRADRFNGVHSLIAWPYYPAEFNRRWTICYTRLLMHAHWGSQEAIVVDYIRQDSDQLLGYWTRTAQTFILFNNYTTYYYKRLVEYPNDLVNVLCDSINAYCLVSRISVYLDIFLSISFSVSLMVREFFTGWR